MTVLPDYAPLFEWIKERERVRIRKDRGDPYHWTEDPIIATYRLCNVRREDDRGTVWVRDHIRTPATPTATPIAFVAAIPSATRARSR